MTDTAARVAQRFRIAARRFPDGKGLSKAYLYDQLSDRIDKIRRREEALAEEAALDGDPPPKGDPNLKYLLDDLHAVLTGHSGTNTKLNVAARLLDVSINSKFTEDGRQAIDYLDWKDNEPTLVVEGLDLYLMSLNEFLALARKRGIKYR